jgi:hypothetical protein
MREADTATQGGARGVAAGRLAQGTWMTIVRWVPG